VLKSIKLIKILIYFLLFSTILTINVIDDSYVFASNNIPKPDSTFKRWFKNLFCLPTKQISIPSNLEMTHAGNQAISRIKDQLNQAYSTTVIKQVMWDDKDIIQKESKNIKIDDEKSLMKEMFFEVKHSGEVNLEYPSIKIDNQNQDFDTNSQKSKKTSFEMNDAEDTCKTPNIKPSERYDTHNEDNNNIGLSDVRTNITEISASQNSIYSSANHPIFQNDSIVEDVNQVRNFNESHVRETADEKEQSVIVIEKPLDDAIVEENQHINQVENLMNFVPPPAEIIPAPEVEAIPRRERLDAAAHIELFVNLDNLQADRIVPPIIEAIEEERQFPPPILVNDQMLNLPNPLDIEHIINEPELPADQREEQLNIQERQEMIIEVPAVVEARHVVVDDAIVEENQHINQVENLMNFVPPPAEIIPAPVRELDDPFAESGYRLDEFFEVAMDPPPAEIIPVIEDLDDSYIEEEFVEKKEDNLITTTISENINSNKKNETNKISAEKYSQLNKDNISNNSAIDLAVKDKIILMIREELQGGLDNNYINLLTTQLNEIHNINKNITENLNNSIFEKYLLEHTLSAGDDNVAIQQNIWINYMYFTGRQKRTGKKDPYSVNSYGIIGGIELVNDKDMMIGMSYGNMFSKIKYPPNKNTASLINSHIFMLYHNSHMFYKPKSKYCYIQSIATIAFNNVKSKFIRKILNNDEEFKVSLKSVDYNFATKFNYNVPIKNFSIIPNIGISYGSNMLNNYNEIGFGNINSINVTYSPINLININIGVNIIGEKILYRGFNILPKLQLSVSQNLNSKDYNLKTTAIVLGETKKYDVLIPKDNKNTYNIGTSIAVNKSKNIKLELMYNYSFDNNKYNSHQFAFKMHLGF